MSDSSSATSNSQEGPDINSLHHRLTEYPKAWLNPALPIFFTALIHDVMFDRCHTLKASDLSVFRRPYQQCEWYRVSLLVAHFLSDDSFTNFKFPSSLLLSLLEHTAKELSQAGPNKVYINDVDRREEFIRVVLNKLNLRPKGETDTQAEDRLQAVSSHERFKVLRAAKAAEQRSHELRVALAKQKAKESADKMTRE